MATRTSAWLVWIVGLLDGDGAARESPPKPEVIGNSLCCSCHPIEARHWASTLPGRLFLEKPRAPLQELACESCDGLGSLHLDEPHHLDRIVAFTRASGPRRST